MFIILYLALAVKDKNSYAVKISAGGRERRSLV
jgi:hypothetical protein